MNVSQASSDAAAAQLHATRALPSPPRPPKVDPDGNHNGPPKTNAASASASLGQSLDISV